MDAQQRPSTKGATLADPTLRQYKLVGGLETFANRSFWPGFFSRVAARKQWDAAAIDFAPDAGAWGALPDERRQRLTTLLAGFRVGEDAVAQQLTPFVAAANRETLASQESLMAWTFTLQRRDEERHARFFDRIAAEVLGLPGETPAERRAAAREYATPGILELFEEQLPAMAAELAAGEAGLGDGVSLYHMLLEGVVFNAGTTALLDDLADGALPGVLEGLERVERDERWHVGFGLRCLIETLPSQERIDDLVARGVAAAAAWGDAVPAAIREHSARTCAHRLHVSGFTERARRSRARSPQGTDPRRVERAGAPPTRARGRADAGDVGAGGAHDRQVLRAQRAGQRHLQPQLVGLVHQRRERVRREPVQEPAAVLDRRVEQAHVDAGGARDARQQLGRERRVRHAPGVRVGARHHHRVGRRRRAPCAAGRSRRPPSRRPRARPSRTSPRCARRRARRAPPCRAGWACRRSRR